MLEEGDQSRSREVEERAAFESLARNQQRKLGGVQVEIEVENGARRVETRRAGIAQRGGREIKDAAER
jgi:hypothetical protein